MPLIESSYVAPPLFGNGHLQTVFANIFRWVTGVHYRRERLETPDRDFLDLDWCAIGSRKVAIISHGLEGSTNQVHIRGMVRALNRKGWDALAWNLRGCSGEPNRLLRSYHSGSTEDLDTVIRHVLARNTYSEVVLIGFSLGGNITLKYLGEQGGQVPAVIRNAVAFSVPCHLPSGVRHMAGWSNKIYMTRFLRSLHKKIRDKKNLMPERSDLLCDKDFFKIKTFKQFDDRYTAPMNGFKNAEHYWSESSSERYLDGIRIPTLLVNAEDDPFLPYSCYPVEKAKTNPYLFLEIPKTGGHVGFVTFEEDGEYWSEKRALSFIEQKVFG